MQQKIIGNMGKGLQGIFIVNGKRFARPVAAGHNQDGRPFFKKKIMQRGVRQHDAETKVERRHLPSRTTRPALFCFLFL